MTRPTGQSDSAGFTLVEALIAVLLMSVIVAALASVTAQWLPSWDRGVGRLQRVEVMADGLERLAGDVSAAEIVSVGRNAPPLFDGDEISIAFVRTILNPNTAAGLEIVRIAEISDQQGLVLVRSTAPFTPQVTDAESVSFVNPVALIRAPYRVTFAYAGSDRVWHGTWHQQALLPRAVRVRLRDAATVSTTALIHAELRASCAAQTGAATQCPELAGKGATAANTAGGTQ